MKGKMGSWCLCVSGCVCNVSVSKSWMFFVLKWDVCGGSSSEADWTICYWTYGRYCKNIKNKVMDGAGLSDSQEILLLLLWVLFSYLIILDDNFITLDILFFCGFSVILIKLLFWKDYISSKLFPKYVSPAGLWEEGRCCKGFVRFFYIT